MSSESPTSGRGIRLANDVAERHLVGIAQTRKRLKMAENSWRENARIIIDKHRVSPTLLLGSVPVGVSSENPGKTASTHKELTVMADKTSKTKRKRLPKGWRTYIRRLKREARKSGIAYRRPVREQPQDKK
jgi:hypothetical protein